MAKLPTQEEKGRMVLKIFEHFGTRPGENLMQQNLVAMMAKWSIRNDDLVDGLKYGHEQGWFEDGPNETICLTESGFAEI